MLFDLSDQAIEQIVFAMEDQENATVVNMETGEIVPAQAGDLFTSPPRWSSREGFRLMEEFLATVRQPSARHDLGEALARGRGVFKAFKAALVLHPEVERAFRDFKIRAMRRNIVAWYDNLREAQGLERLGPEPEDTAELIAADLELRVMSIGQARALYYPLIDEAEAESLEHLPAVVSQFEFGRLRAELEHGEEGLCAVADDGEGGALGAALAFRVANGERSLGRIVFLAVREGFRRMGLGKALLEKLAESFRAEGTGTIIIDSAFLPPEFAESLAALGYRPYGARSVSRME